MTKIVKWVREALTEQMGHDVRKPNFDACEQQTCRPAFTSVQTDWSHCYSSSGKLSS